MQVAESSQRLRNQLLDSGRIRDVGINVLRPAARGVDGVVRRLPSLARIRADVPDDHACAFLGKSQRARAPNTRAGTGDDGYLAFKSPDHVGTSPYSTSTIISISTEIR